MPLSEQEFNYFNERNPVQITPISQEELGRRKALADMQLNQSQAIAAAEEQNRRRKLAELEASPAGQALREREAVEKSLATNPALRQKFMEMREQARIQQQKPPAAPAGYRMNPDGSMAFIPGGPADPKQAGALAAGKHDVNIMGGRESVFLNRVLTASNQVNKDLANIVELPIESTRGIFGGRGQGTSLFEAAKETLANKMTTQEVQSYNTLATGIQRNLAAIEASGLAPPNSLMHMMDAVVFKEGDTNFTKLQKLAQTRQVVEAGLETILTNPRVAKEQKDHANELLDGIRKAVPFSGRDLIALGRLQQTNPNVKLRDVMAMAKEGDIQGKLKDSGIPYEPNLYDYRVVDGKIQRKKK